LIWFEARLKKFGDHFPIELTESDIRGFLYVEYMREHEGAVAQFIDLLNCYRIEQRPTSISAFDATYLALKAEQQSSRKSDQGGTSLGVRSIK
jgi:hypothetical protein